MFAASARRAQPTFNQSFSLMKQTECTTTGREPIALSDPSVLERDKTASKPRSLSEI